MRAILAIVAGLVVVMMRRIGRGVADNGAIVVTYDAGAPQRPATVVVADEIALGVNRRPTGLVAADVNVRFIRPGFSLRSSSQQGKRGDRAGDEDGFHKFNGVSVTQASTGGEGIYSGGNQFFKC